MSYKSLLDYSLEALKSAGATHGQITLVVTKKHELSTEANKIKLFRNNENTKLSLSYIKNHRKATTSINKVTKNTVDEAVLKLVELAKAAPEDDANDIAESVEDEIFSVGVLEPDIDVMYDSLYNFTEEIKTLHKKIVCDAILSYDYKNIYVVNTNGLYLEETRGNYNYLMVFSAKDREKITSFNYISASLLNLKEQLSSTAMLDELLKQTVDELEAKPFVGKFVGDVIIAPTCLGSFIDNIASIALMDTSLITESSKFKDKIGEIVSDDQFTWHSNPRSKEFASGYSITGDGFIAENLTIIDNGILKSHLLSQYGAKKVGGERAKNYGGAFEIEAGNCKLDDMIKKIGKGILLSRFSGGNPGADGGFSGIAKNSFYIEGGKIKYPMSETMISGNLYEIIRNIQTISEKRINFGSSILPWIHTNGITISGK